MIDLHAYQHTSLNFRCAMTTNAPFALERATEADLDEILQVQFDAFPDPIRQLCMGCKSQADLPKIRNVYAKHMRENPHDVWVKVTDTENGRIASAGNWRVYVNGEGAKSDPEPPLEWLEGEMRDNSRHFLDTMYNTRVKEMRGAHICM